MIAAAMTSFDEAFQAGRSRLQAGHASRAAIVLGLGDVSTAETALRAARRLDESGYRASIAASRLLADRDLFEAAVDYVGRALGDDPGVHGEQYAHLRAAELHGKLGGTALATEAAKLALDKWDDADVPDTIPEGALRAVIVSELGVSIAVDGDKPLSLILAIEPLVALLPEHAASRESVTKIKETAPTPATPPTP